MTPPHPAPPTRHTVEDPSQVRLAAEHAARAARAADFGPAAVHSITLAATELAENLHRHAVGGELVVVPPVTAVDLLTVLAVDRGPGVERFERCLDDGYTTIGTMGVGLGTVRRLAARFDAVSEPGRGTVVAAGFRHDADGRLRRTGDRRREEPAPSPTFDVAAIGFPISPELPNGDGWTALHRGARLIVVVADGLGHGPAAADASRAVIGAVPGLADRAPADIMTGLAGAARATRGAAVTVAVLAATTAVDGGAVDSSGLGNVALVVVAPDGSSRRGVGFPGTVGRVPSTTRAASTEFPAGGTLVLHTDGLQTHWELTGRSELLRHDAVVVAAALWRDFARGTDDSYVVVVHDGSRR